MSLELKEVREAFEFGFSDLNQPLEFSSWWIKEQFDEWLQSVRAKAWYEGFDAGEQDVWEHEHHPDGFDSDCIKNPYEVEK